MNKRNDSLLLSLYQTFRHEIDASDVTLTVETLLVLALLIYAFYGIAYVHFPKNLSRLATLFTPDPHLILPKKVFLVRHGQSRGNVDQKSYTTTPDWAIPLTEQGKKEAFQAGLQIKRECGETPVIVYFSPYKRTKATMKQVLRAFPHKQIYLVQEEPRIREQDFGNFQNTSRMKICKRERLSFSRFFYRFPSGESGADVYDRVSSFMESLFRLFRKEKTTGNSNDFNLIIVSHGLTIRVLLMRWFRWSVSEFETMVNPVNASPIIMERKNSSGRKYRLTKESWEMLHTYGNKKMKARTELRRHSYTRKNLIDILNSDNETASDSPSRLKKHHHSLDSIDEATTSQKTEVETGVGVEEKERERVESQELVMGEDWEVEFQKSNHVLKNQKKLEKILKKGVNGYDGTFENAEMEKINGVNSQ